MNAKIRFVLVLGMLLSVASAASAQIAAGNVSGRVSDPTGAVLQGVEVSLESDAGRRATVSGGGGEFRFLNLTRGEYTLRLSLRGFASLTRGIEVTTGEDVDLLLTMPLAAIEEVVSVRGESPLVNTRKRGTATTMTALELSQVPNARDPWAVLRAVPGVTVDRVNIAGSENGQQAAYTGKGTTQASSNWNLDGLVITDMSSLGTSPTYFDFEALEEIHVTTGGSDLAAQAGGVGINLTTKRGTNRFHGGGRYLLSHDDLSRSNLPASLDGDPRLQNPDGTRRDKADHIQQIGDYGLEIGGPILRDKLWFYATWGKQDIRLVRLNGTADGTLLPASNVKLNWQPTPGTQVSGLWFQCEKQVFGREPGGWGVQQAESFLWDQRNVSTEGGLPGGLWKLQVDHTFSADLLVSVKAAYYDAGFVLTPRGGTRQAWTIDYYNGEAIGSFAEYVAIRPQKNVTVDGSYFFQGLGGTNDLKLGFSWRDYKTTSGYVIGGSGLVGYMESATGGTVEVDRSAPVAYAGEYWSAYLGDVLTRDRLSVNLGLRWDLQRARNLPASVAANAAFPDVLPALVYPGDSGYPIEWEFVSPRAGASYALTESRRTVLRASYALYGGMLSFGGVKDINPVAWGWMAYPWKDLNGDRFVQPDEVLFDRLLYSGNVNLADPSTAQSPNRIDADYGPTRDHEVVVGLEHEITPGFAAGAAYTWRRTTGRAYRPRLSGSCPELDATLDNCRVIQPDEYVRNAPAGANGYTAFTYFPPAALVDAGQGGRIRTNPRGYRRTYDGLELTLVKRLSNRWMGRLALSLNDWTEAWENDPYAINGYPGNPTPTQWDPQVQGGQVTFVGEKGTTSNIRWQVYANGLVQLPWALEASGALFARQGGAYPVSLRLRAGRDGTIEALATERPDSLRYGSLVNLDLRLAKTIVLRGDARLVLSAEWFNVLNSGTVLGRYMYANSAAFTDAAGGAVEGRGRIEEILSPSILRLGLRLSF